MLPLSLEYILLGQLINHFHKGELYREKTEDKLENQQSIKNINQKVTHKLQEVKR